MMTGKPEAALATFDAAIADGDAREELRFNRAVVLLKLRRFELASTALSPLTASQDLSMSTRARLHLAIALEGQGKLPAAEAELLEALRLDDAYDDAWVYLGALRERRGDFRQAGEAYKAHLKRHPDAVVSLLRFGIVAWRAGYPDTAVKQLRRVRELAPNSVEAAEAAKFLLLLE